MSEQDTSAAEATISDEELELDTDLEDTEDVEALKAQVAKDKIAKQQILARAKKAEAENKLLKKPKDAEATQTTTTNNALSASDVEVTILKAQKVTDDEIDYLKKLAKVNGTTLIEAQSDELYLAFKTKKDADEKSAKANLGASRGSGSVKKDKDFTSPGLSKEDHKELWKKQNGQ